MSHFKTSCHVSILIHALIPFFGSTRGTKHNGFLVIPGCLFSRKVCWGVRIGNFCPKFRYFTDQNGPKGGPHQNEYWLFSNKKCYKQLERKN